MEELKIKISDKKPAEEKLGGLGAELKKEVESSETYFKGQNRDAPKIVETEDGDYLRRYEDREEGFELTRDEKLENPEEERKALEERFGVKACQDKTQKFYELNGKQVILITIEDLGDFLVVQGENVEKNFIESKIGLEDPDYIEVPFSQLEQE